ncbi:baseplate J/gp47 family protein [Clostridiaceae bacterium UIB06]|uniref:Baseplate J/gp47 family protein n=1 Tax=Clostridium thailandense TaxID=2794346 RepID=A0A949TXM8_9CLOT|nr:baseplate J/gp47 family protein [Clostridium thailandense]MBV7275456.1 baseplate J/gp47 family protein [Clostridium thailandense]MCH5136683.1 baseplate J/gp47 family protein [Clostridiaceae bacterium UIB06]
MYSEDYKIILNRMLNNVSNDIDKTEGFLVQDALSPASMEFSNAYSKLDEVLNKVFAHTAAKNGFSEELEKRCEEFGITRKPGTPSVGQVSFTGNENTAIPIGTIVQTSGGLQYYTTDNGTIQGGNAAVNIQALKVGNAYNVPANTINKLPVQIVGITGVTNTEPTTGGTEIESNEELLNRLLLQVQKPATSGNINHYKIWATEVNGVGDAIVIPTWNGSGTVKVIILDSNKHSPSQKLIDEVTAHIEEERPIGAEVTIAGAVEIPIDISVTLQLESGADINSVREEIEKGISNYLNGIAFKSSLVRYTRIENVLLDISRIVDYSNLKVNDDFLNIEIPQGNVASLGMVTVNAA